MGKPAARVGDMHVCPMVDGVKPHVGGPVLPAGVPNVLIGGMPAAAMGDMCTCVGAPDVIVMGSTGVMIGGRPAARMGDMTAHGGSVVLGCFTVLIGEVAGSGGSAGGAGGGNAIGADGSTAGAAQAKDITNAQSLKKAAQSGAATAEKKEKENYTAKYKLKDDAGKAVADKKYEITTSDGKVHDGKTNANGETQQLSGYTIGDCSIKFKK